LIVEFHFFPKILRERLQLITSQVTAQRQLLLAGTATTQCPTIYLHVSYKTPCRWMCSLIMSMIPKGLH